VTIPTAEIIAIRNYRGLRAIRCLCPYCGRTDLHPWPASHETPGVYTAPCGRGDYRIEAP
jgi:hypothetical protein